MAYKQVLMRRARIITPPEAHDIAGQLRSLARETHDLGREAGSLLQRLNAGWQGRSRERFFRTYAALPSRVGGAGSLADRLAGKVESTTVTVWETASETIWQADSPAID